MDFSIQPLIEFFRIVLRFPLGNLETGQDNVCLCVHDGHRVGYDYVPDVVYALCADGVPNVCGIGDLVFNKENRKLWFFGVLVTLFGIQILFLILHMNFYWAA